MPGKCPSSILNDFLLYRQDCHHRYPEVFAILGHSPQQRSSAIADLWHGETNDVRNRYMDRYNNSRLKAGYPPLKESLAARKKRLARSNARRHAVARRKKNIAPELIMRRQRIVELALRGIRGHQLINTLGDTTDEEREAVASVMRTSPEPELVQQEPPASSDWYQHGQGGPQAAGQPLDFSDCTAAHGCGWPTVMPTTMAASSTTVLAPSAVLPSPFTTTSDGFAGWPTCSGSTSLDPAISAAIGTSSALTASDAAQTLPSDPSLNYWNTTAQPTLQSQFDSGFPAIASPRPTYPDFGACGVPGGSEAVGLSWEDLLKDLHI